MIAQWPYQSTPYLSALPGVAGFGLDVTDGDKPSKIYFITSYADTDEGGISDLGPNCFEGTFRWCWTENQGAGFHKWIVSLIGGYVYLGRKVNSPAGLGDMDYIGHAAPGAGLFFQATAINLQGGSNVRIWHCPSWVGDLPSAEGQNFDAGLRDGHQASADGYHARNVAHINCEAAFTMDESVQVFYAMDGISWIRGAVYDPLHSPPEFMDPEIAHHEPGTDHGFGHLVGGSDLLDHSLSLQSLYAHTTDRNPLVAATNHAQVNCLHYDHGRVNYSKGEGLNIDDNGGFNEAAGLSMQCNLVGCVSVRGPNNNDSLVMANVLHDLPAGSSGHSALNCQFGWEPPESQDDFFTKKPVGYLQPTLRAEAWPQGLGFDYDGVLRPAIALLRPFRQEGLAFSQLMRTTVGCKPAKRYLYEGGLNKIFDQIDNAIRGIPAPSQWVNTVAEAGGWPRVPFASVDPLKPGLEWHEPIPLGADRDEVLTSGHFVDGTSKAGYSRLRAWVIDLYFYNQGR